MSYTQIIMRVKSADLACYIDGCQWVAEGTLGSKSTNNLRQLMLSGSVVKRLHTSVTMARVRLWQPLAVCM